MFDSITSVVDRIPIFGAASRMVSARMLPEIEAEAGCTSSCYPPLCGDRRLVSCAYYWYCTGSGCNGCGGGHC